MTTTSVSSAVPTHGNYHNYHGYLCHHPGGHDSRLALLPRELLLNACVLDVGCNEGWVSCEIAQSCGARRVVGVDIDDALVRMAWRRRRVLWSHQGATSEPSPPSSESRSKRKRVHTAPSIPQVDHFPASCQHMFGPLPITDTDMLDSEAIAYTFPHNITFRRADWVNERIPEDDAGYDVIVAFSVSKWIHLNGGDVGLRRFFERVYASLVPGGAFILEAQPRESYTKARKLHPVRNVAFLHPSSQLIYLFSMQTLQENAQALQIQPEGFEVILCSMGFDPAQRLGEPGEGREYPFHGPDQRPNH
ncbi:S-adenosyl-L-methionine-dependent methyltransferase [Multifurca ochricompacta]|uniref:RNA methyltransferase n=1 Tax=Multifurca ochricompacta TaxID=376703 RepID=A0AAD4QSF6_9AGAM|nr:S-adenosyl-L-methionine-dependent methyltransferase [Multifurca ochricompacta]